MGEEAIGVLAEAAEKENEVGVGGVGRDGVLDAVCSACGKESGEFVLV